MVLPDLLWRKPSQLAGSKVALVLAVLLHCVAKDLVPHLHNRLFTEEWKWVGYRNR